MVNLIESTTVRHDLVRVHAGLRSEICMSQGYSLIDFDILLSVITPITN